MLSDYITSDLIKLQVEVADWQGALRAGGEMLIQAGLCEPRYIEAMIDAVNDLGPYMVLAPGIALAHARPEDGVLKMGMSIMTLATPVEFGAEENDPVKLVISFGGVDNKSHLGMLQELAIFLSDEEKQAQLKNATDIDEVLKLFADN